MKKTSFFVLAAVFCLGLINRTAEAGRLPEEWDALPQVESFAFTKTAIGLVAGDHSYFILDTKEGTFKAIPETEFKRQFPAPTQRAAEVVNNTGIGSEVRLRTSGALTFFVKNAYCSEGENITHRLSLDGKPLKDFVRPCYSVSAVEVVGDQLWLGTRADLEYGDYPAEGIVIQSFDGRKKIGQISAKNGLTGNLVRAIRLSPVDSLIWVATNQGINAVSKNLKVEKSIYFYQDFDPATGKPTVLTSPRPKKNPAVVEFARQLHLADYKSFYSTLRTIPPEAIDKFMNGMGGLYAPINASVGREVFAPAEVNKLVPFFIEASRSSDKMARAASLSALCATNDSRAIARFVELRSAPQGYGSFESDFVPRCLDKYALFKLLPKDNANDLALKLKADIQAALNARSASGQSMQVVQNAISLNKMGDPSGMDLINEYFKRSDGNDDDASFYEFVGQFMTYENGISPAMVEGLQKFHTYHVTRGCMYFDMRWKFMPRRFDAAYAKAILIAVTHAMSEEWRSRRTTAGPEFWSQLTKTCTGAFKSQLDDPATKAAFMGKIYGTLSPSEKALADQMASGKQPSMPSN
jgi:hypothetical protein